MINSEIHLFVFAANIWEYLLRKNSCEILPARQGPESKLPGQNLWDCYKTNMRNTFLTHKNVRVLFFGVSETNLLQVPQIAIWVGIL